MVNKMEIMEAEKMSPQDTFRFRCDSCGKCCRNRGAILLNPHDIVRMQKYLELSLKEILDIYCEAYIGESSRVPIVRLRHAAVCVFLMHGKCLIQEAKPSVCVLYPLGRITEVGKTDVKYFLQDVGCGKRDRENHVADWLRNLGEDHEECACIWYSLIGEASDFMRDLPKGAGLQNLQEALFGLLYDGYDCDSPLAPQLRGRLDAFRRFFRKPEGGCAGSDDGRRADDGQADDDI